MLFLLNLRGFAAPRRMRTKREGEGESEKDGEGRTGVYAQVAQSSASNWGVWVNAKTYVKRQKRRRQRRVEAFFVGFI